jgi:hypothetical protein
MEHNPETDALLGSLLEDDDVQNLLLGLQRFSEAAEKFASTSSADSHRLARVRLLIKTFSKSRPEHLAPACVGAYALLMERAVELNRLAQAGTLSEEQASEHETLTQLEQIALIYMQENGVNPLA